VYDASEHERVEVKVHIYKLGEKLGSGSFGDVYRGHPLDKSAQGNDVAIKLEHKDAKHPQLQYEYKVYKVLQADAATPRVIWCGYEGGYNVLVMELMGPSLESLRVSCGGKFSAWTVARVGVQMVERAQHIHDKGYVHRDIKPDNFVVGTGSRSTHVYAVDFGLSKRYRVGGVHVPYKKKKSLVGTVNYASIHNHMGHEQSRRDDMESIGYVLMHLLLGRLPWKGTKGKTRAERDKKIGRLKGNMLTQKTPRLIGDYFTHVRCLEFEERPDYVYLLNLLERMASESRKASGIVDYDWVLNGL